jgi:hypothetical protein
MKMTTRRVCVGMLAASSLMFLITAGQLAWGECSCYVLDYYSCSEMSGAGSCGDTCASTNCGSWEGVEDLYDVPIVRSAETGESGYSMYGIYGPGVCGLWHECAMTTDDCYNEHHMYLGYYCQDGDPIAMWQYSYYYDVGGSSCVGG